MAGIRFYFTSLAPDKTSVAAGHIDVVMPFPEVRADPKIFEAVEQVVLRQFFEALIHEWRMQSDIVAPDLQITAYKEIEA